MIPTKKLFKIFGKISVVLLLGFGIFKSFDFYQQNRLEMKKIEGLHVTTAQQKPFVVIITAHNSAAFCEKTIFSVLTQNYQNFRVLYVDDGAADSSLAKAESMVKLLPHKDKISFIKHPENKGSLAALYDIIASCNNREIVLLIDGCDFLAHENVLAKLNRVYAKPSTWMTYGNFLDYPSYRQIPVKCKQIPKNVIFNNSFRSYELADMHLKTFYAGLFKKIRKEDLAYKGKFIPSEGGLAYFLPLLEMAGKHACFINEVLYLHTKTCPSLSAECVAHIKKLPKYQRLSSLFSEEP